MPSTSQHPLETHAISRRRHALLEMRRRARACARNAQTHLADATQRIGHIDAQMATLRAVTGETIAADIDDLVYRGAIRSARPSGNAGLEIETGRILCQRRSDGAQFLLGRIRILISLERQTIHFKALDQVHPYWDHPHCMGGTACFGNVQQTVTQLLSEGQLVSLILILLNFLASANDSDAWGHSICTWPKLSEPNQDPDKAVPECDPDAYRHEHYGGDADDEYDDEDDDI